MNEQDIDRIADNGRLAAGLVQSRGLAALERAHAWKSNLRGARLDPDSGGWQYDQGSEDDEPAAIPNDPTGEAGTEPTPAEQLLHARLNAALTAYNTAAQTVIHLVYQASPTAPPRLEDGPGDDYCESCYRDGKWLEPAAVHKDGRAKYKGLCSWCGGFRRTYQRVPPLSLLKIHREGRRVTEDDLKRAGVKVAS